ncbi:DUF2092 domain-containing protein [Roseiconus lacunae]|uniref:DUF2092 domain-containing protein n=1 Tax=Roseiconus lacunae TaxID=2605694 RepID=UPI001E51AE94|nr:DUF2092 domain-containing protein [Roseiconus lacunae]MCD0462639.1 DUF2092 domain-containing protein [Roseiconus lacunae]
MKFNPMLFSCPILLAGTLLVCMPVVAPAQDAEQTTVADITAADKTDDSDSQDPVQPAEEPPAIDDKTVEAIDALFDRLRQAKSTRTTIKVAEETIIEGAVIGSKESSYQIASTAPNQFTVYYKSEQQRTRIYNNETTATIAITPSAFTSLEQPLKMQHAVFELPFPMGPYPEPVLALSLAGVDPSLSLLSGMKSVEIADRKPFRGKTAAIHFVGVQDDDVRWDLWITQREPIRPLRLRVNLTEMLRQNGSLDLPDDYQFVLRFDFDMWKVDNENSSGLFEYAKIKDATEYKTLQEYFDATKSPRSE